MISYNNCCKICMSPIEDAITLTCNHSFCKECFIAHVLYSLKALQISQSQLSCAECQFLIAIKDLQQFLPQNIFEQFLDSSLKQTKAVSPNEKTFSCRCGNFYMVQKDADYVNCPKCVIKICILCKDEYHDGISCQMYQEIKFKSDEEQKFYKYAKQNGLKKCPHCSEFIEKINGCNFITCNCDCRFCFICLKILTAEDHYSHYKNSDPWTNGCKGESQNPLKKDPQEYFQECPNCHEQCEVIRNLDNHFCYCKSKLCNGGTFYCLISQLQIAQEDIYEHFENRHMCTKSNHLNQNCHIF